MSFTFRLSTLRKLRDQTRDERRRELAQAYEAERLLQEQIDQLLAELASNQSLLRGLAASSAVAVDSLSAARRYESVLKMQVAHLRGQLAQVKSETERRREALLAADRDVKALDQLHERQRLAYGTQQARSEQRMLDDVALRGHRATTREPS